jgi:hypothetical protein
LRETKCASGPTLANINEASIDAIALNFNTYFKFTENGLEIGKTGDGASPIITRITNDRTEWVLAGTETVILYIDATTNKLHINDAEVDTLSVGNDANGYIVFDMTSDGMFIKVRE